MQLMIEYLLNMQNHLLLLADSGRMRDKKLEHSLHKQASDMKRKEVPICVDLLCALVTLLSWCLGGNQAPEEAASIHEEATHSIWSD